jgi:hypothetical protein
VSWHPRDLLGARLHTQRPGLAAGGPLTPALRAMAETPAGGQPLSPVGAEVARLISPLTIRVAFLPTDGSGATPWRRTLVLDVSYRGPAQAGSPTRLGLVAHELTHVLQRELDDSHFWPAGSLRPSRSRRWLGDSTNYMEALAYLVGGSVELDLLEARGMPVNRRLLDDLATFAGEDAANAARYVSKRFPGNAVYRKNMREEARTPDRRIPDGGWAHWLGRLGFSPPAVDRIRAQAARGTLQQADPEGPGPG